MIINHNMNALNAQRNMTINNSQAGKSMEKLSSGLRINRAGDDAAGLAISEKMRGQIRGLDQASRNAQDGISMIQTAEGALNETHSILQRMRELAVQAGNDTNTPSDRGEIQKEINQLSSEINRIGNTTEFNNQKLLDGTKANSGVTTVTAGKAEAGLAALDVVTDKDGVTHVAGSPEVDAAKAKATLTGDLSVTAKENGDAHNFSWEIKKAASGHSKTTASYDKGTKTLTIELGTDSGELTQEKVANAINNMSGDKTEFNNDYQVTSTTGTNPVSDADVAKTTTTNGKDHADATPEVTAVKGQYHFRFQGGDLQIDGETLSDVTEANFATKFAANGTLAGKYDATFVDGKVSLTQKDTKESPTAPTVSGTTPAVKGEYTFEVGKQDVSIDGKTFTYDKSKKADNSFSNIDELKDLINDNATLRDKYTASVVDGKLKLVQKEGHESATAPVVTGYKDSSVSLQIGANENQSMILSIGDMRSEALGLTSKDLSNGFNGTKDVTDGTNDTGVEYSLDVSDAKVAGAAVTKIQTAIDKVSAERSKLGAYQNRLEHTVNNLGTSSENLTSAESRVRDVDMAKEMMTFSKNNILQQAAQAMLAQANQQPQSVLQLLR